MRGVEVAREAVEEFAPYRRPVSQKAVHVGRDPRHRDVFGQHRLAARRFAFDMDEPPFAVGIVNGVIASRADAQRPLVGTQFYGYGPGIACCAVLQIRQRATAQAAPRNQETDGFEKIGFAAAVRACQDDRRARRIEPQAFIVPEGRERDFGNGEGSGA